MSSDLLISLSILVILFVLLILLITLEVKLVKRLFGRNSLQQHEYSAKLVSVGVIGLLFKNTLYTVLIAPVLMLIEQTGSIVSHLNADGTDLNIEKLESAFNQFLAYLPVGRVFFMVALGVILYKGMTYLFRGSAAAGQQSAAYPIIISNSIILAILAFSLFLVTSVLISIPYFNEARKPSSFTTKGLDTVLKSMQGSDSALITRDLALAGFFPNIRMADTLLKDTTAHLFKNLSTAVQADVNQVFTHIDRLIQSHNLERATAIRNINAAIARYNKEKTYSLSVLTTRFENALQNQSVDKDKLFNMSVESYSRYIRNFNFALDRAYTSIIERDLYNSNEITRLFNRLNTFINMYPQISDSTIGHQYESLSLRYISPNFQNYGFNQLSGVLENMEVPQIIVKDGSEWGFFGFISRYLIRTNSPDLALLIGMFGFGLLGAAASSIPKTDLAADPAAPKNVMELFRTRPIINNFWFVLARGFLAAVLIYVATKSGITIITSNSETDSNGYVLLFLCFIGALFSKKVWEKVEERV